MLVVSIEDQAAPRALSICAPITTSTRGSAYEIPIGKPTFLHAQSFVNVQGLQAIQHHELLRKLGKLSDQQINEVKNALRFALGL